MATRSQRTFAIASHVVHGYVGNTVVSFVGQLLGYEMSALNTVQFSNHTGYRRWKGTKTSPQQLLEIYEGLAENDLDRFDNLITGYIPGGDGVQAVGKIADALKAKYGPSLFWVLDPVMGDEGQLYVSEDVIPIYKSLLYKADLIVPNEFEAELLSNIKISSLVTLSQAITYIHQIYHVPHIVVSSVSFEKSKGMVVCAGSTARSDWTARPFKISVPLVDGLFVGTGDLFASLTLVRFKEASNHLQSVPSRVSPDDVANVDLPLAKGLVNVLASMSAVLKRTRTARDQELSLLATKDGSDAVRQRMKASELQLVESQEELKHPPPSLFRPADLLDGDGSH